MPDHAISGANDQRPAVVITGASSGIGQGIAVAAAGDGLPMVLIGRSIRGLQATIQLLPESGSSYPLVIDLSSPNATGTIANALDERGLYCDVLVNSAGFGVFSPIHSSALDQQSALIDVNVRAVVDLCSRFLPGMVARRRGGILNISSITSYAPGPNMAAYFASKAFIRSYTLAMAEEVKAFNVKVCCLTPGVVRTPFFQRCDIGRTKMMKLMPRGDVEPTVTAAWEGFKEGRSFVMPGWGNRVIASVASLTPERLLARLVKRLQC